MPSDPRVLQNCHGRQELRDFLMHACHDLRSALRAVKINAELLQRPEKRQGPDAEQILDFLVNGAGKVDALVTGLSNYALALDVRPDPAPVSIGLVLRAALAKLEAEIRRCGAEVTCGDLPRVPGDPNRLTQLFENLLQNALHHRGDVPPRIDVSAQEGRGESVFAVRDNGPGIEAEDLERIFRPFERLKPQPGHAGLGLAICREIAVGHGGRIWAESIPGQGTTVYLALPCE